MKKALIKIAVCMLVVVVVLSVLPFSAFAHTSDNSFERITDNSETKFSDSAIKIEDS